MYSSNISYASNYSGIGAANSITSSQHSYLSNITRSEPPSNIYRGLVGMGQAVITSDKKLFTFGCGPCIGVAIDYRSSSNVRSYLLAHLQPEANLDVFCNTAASYFPDDLGSEMSVKTTTVPSKNTTEKDLQSNATSKIGNTLYHKYEYTDVSFSSSKKSAIQIDRNSSKTSDSSSSFDGDELSYMSQHMLQNSSDIRFFRV
tara:strand:- start:1142 stop:1747 length:606 start_codon:yes stop_codon:yes gene_type:complete